MNPGFGKDGEGDFLLVVCGSTQIAPFLKGWHEFKDHLRSVVRQQPGWVDVFPSQNQRQGEAQGWARLRFLEDSEAAYKLYYHLKETLVHVFETGRSSEGYRLRKCNCSIHFGEIPEGGHSPGRCGIDVARFKGLSGHAVAISSSPYMTAQPTYASSSYPSPQIYTVMPAFAVQVSQPPVYSTNFTGIPVNTDNGAILPQVWIIIIRNLNYKIEAEELVSLLNTIGRPIHYRLHKDSRTGAFKGIATAEFSSKLEAQYAVNYLNGREHMGMRLEVRMGTDTTVVDCAEPVIANGSIANNGYRV